MRLNDPGEVAPQYEREASLQHDGEVELAPYELPLRIRRSSSIFVAEKAA